MAYRELIIVADGTMKQLDNCISALDLHQDPPDEVETLLDQLEAARTTCETIINKANDEPEEEPQAAPAS